MKRLGDAWYRAERVSARRPAAFHCGARARRRTMRWPTPTLLIKLSQGRGEARQVRPRRSAGPSRRATSFRSCPARTPRGRRRGPARGTPCLLQAGGPDDRGARMGRAAPRPRPRRSTTRRRSGEAYFVMGWAYGELGKEDAQPQMQRSLEAYAAVGQPACGRPSVLANLGVDAVSWEGRWDEALSLFRARPRRGAEDRQHRRRGAWRA